MVLLYLACTCQELGDDLLWPIKRIIVPPSQDVVHVYVVRYCKGKVEKWGGGVGSDLSELSFANNEKVDRMKIKMLIVIQKT